MVGPEDGSPADIFLTHSKNCCIHSNILNEVVGLEDGSPADIHYYWLFVIGCNLKFKV